MKVYNYKDLSKRDILTLCKRSSAISDDVILTAKSIINDVKEYKDQALFKYCELFDGVKLNNLKVSEQEFIDANLKISQQLKGSINIAKQNIEKFHKSQFCQPINKEETTKGVTCWQEFRPIDTVGLYIPGGSAPLFSTVLMLAIPARLAGCQNVIFVTPPGQDGLIAPEILYTIHTCGFNTVYKIGGAQAIAALAYGTESIPNVNKIFGPGNKYVTAAKVLVSSNVAIDMPAGPSEVLIIADKTANPSFIASDLLSQAEHGSDSQAILLSTNIDLTEKVLSELLKQIDLLNRGEIILSAIKNSFIINTESLDSALEFSNIYAPEHLILNFADYQDYIHKVKHAGSVFCGQYSSVAFGDYASGTNHTLPTSGFAHSFSGVSAASFGKMLTFQEITNQGLINLGPIVENMAQSEGLDAHRISINLRIIHEKSTIR